MEMGIVVKIHVPIHMATPSNTVLNDVENRLLFGHIWRLGWAPWEHG
jgi:hypothetical protein